MHVRVWVCTCTCVLIGAAGAGSGRHRGPSILKAEARKGATTAAAHWPDDFSQGSGPQTLSEEH